MLMLFRQMSQNVPRRRRAWAWPRPQNWFRSLLANPALNLLWKEHFRVTRETFDYLCDLVRVNLQKQHTRFRDRVSVEERVGLSLWRLATGNSYRSCGLQFGLGKSTAKSICSEFEQAIFNLKNRFIQFPLTTQEIQNKPLHEEPGQKPSQPGKAWPGRAFRVFGQAYQENAAW